MTIKRSSKPFHQVQKHKAQISNPKGKSKDGIERLIEIFNNRISKIVQHSLNRFMNTIKEHPDFKDEKIPFTSDDRTRAENATDDLEKIVFVLGAGTSKSAGLSMAKEIVEYCELALGKKLLTDEVALIRSNLNKNKKAEKIRLYSELSNNEIPYTFEEVLSVYQKVLGSEEAIQLLKEHFHISEENFPNKTLITLFNECLAHLAREHLVDFVVTFNFDELLEHSIKEDIGPNSYVNIMSPAEFKWADIHGLFDSSSRGYSNPEQRDAYRGCYRSKLWLLKPHGTISHENTLRHLIQQVWQFETEKENVLKRIFKNSHIVVVGYSLSAADLHRILITHALSGSIKGLYWINPSDMPGDLGVNLKNTIEKINPGSFFHIKSDADTFALKLFEKLYSENNFKMEEVKMSGLIPPFRHLIRAFVFQKENGLDCTFENRFILEMIIYAIRMKGWFSSRTANKCQQINHLVNCATHTQRDSIRKLPEKLKPFFISFPRKNRAERLFILRTHFLNNEKIGNVNKISKKKSGLIDLIPQCIPKEMGGCNPKKEIGNTYAWAEVAAKFCKKLQESQDVSPYPNYGDFATFNKILIIPNKAVLTALTKWLFEKDSNLYCVSETGEFIINRLTKRKEIKEIKKFSGIALGNYIDEWDAIQNELKKSMLFEELQKSQSFKEWAKNPKNSKKFKAIISIEDYSVLREKLKEFRDIDFTEVNDYFYLKDIEKSIDCIHKIKDYVKSKKIVRLSQTFRKRFHLTLWKDEKVNKVFGILFDRVDRQAGTTFNWIKLDLNDPHEYSQFQAFLNYIKGYKTPNKHEKKQ